MLLSTAANIHSGAKWMGNAQCWCELVYVSRLLTNWKNGLLVVCRAVEKKRYEYCRTQTI